MTTCNEIRKLLQKYRVVLETTAPVEYQDLRVSYCKGHNDPSEPKQKRDLLFLRKCVKE